MVCRQISEKITSTISTAWHLTTKSDGMWARPLPASIACAPSGTGGHGRHAPPPALHPVRCAEAYTDGRAAVLSRPTGRHGRLLSRVARSFWHALCWPFPREKLSLEEREISPLHGRSGYGGDH